MRRILSGLAVTTALVGAAVPVPAANPTEPPEPPADLTPGEIAKHVHHLKPKVTHLDPSRWIREFEIEVPDEAEGVVVLEADFLFTTYSWDLPGGAVERIADLVAEIPDGASVSVEGHTDSRPVDQSAYDFDNQILSERRAEAVAAVLRAERPDLQLTVAGFGDTRPAVTEKPDDMSTYAENRRVEIHFEG